jgi:hypothetical protein
VLKLVSSSHSLKSLVSPFLELSCDKRNTCTLPSHLSQLTRNLIQTSYFREGNFLFS